MDNEKDNEVKTGEVLKFGERKSDSPKTPNQRGIRFTLEQDAALKKISWKYQRDISEVVRDCVELALPVLDREYREIAKRKLSSK